MSEIQEAIISN